MGVSAAIKRLSAVAASASLLSAGLQQAQATEPRNQSTESDPSNRCAVERTPKPSAPSEDVAPSQAFFSALEEIESSLTLKFPETYAGIRANPDGRVVVQGSDDLAALRSSTESLLSQYPSAERDELPRVEFALVPNSLARLNSVKEAVVADVAAIKDPQLAIRGAGVDTARNCVIVFTERVGIQKELQARYGFPDLLVAEGLSDVARTASRTTDTPPWTAGDLIIDGGEGFCTTGFGVHKSNGAHGVLTSGHCQDRAWFNSPVWPHDYSRYLGSTSIQLLADGTPDVQLIPTDSSYYFWKLTNTRSIVSGSLAPATDHWVCMEGAISYQQCGQTFGVNVTLTWEDGITTVDMFAFMDSWAIPGDSGAPIVWPTNYGFAAQGIVVGVAKFGLPGIGEVRATLGQNIKGIESALLVETNTPFNP